MWQAIHCHELLAYPCSQEVLIELTVVVISFSNLCFHYGAMLFVRATLKQLTRICFKTQLVFASLTCNTKKVVFSVSCFSSRVFKIHMKPATFFCQAMNLVQSEPKLTIQISKASFVVFPAAIEINRAVQSLLEHCPPPTDCRLVTIHVEGTCVVGVDCIDTAVPFTSFVEFSTVLVNCQG